MIPPASTVKDAIHQLNETGLKILFVADERERLLGTLSDGDIRRAIIAGSALTTPVDVVMRRDFFAVTPASPDAALEARRIMRENLIEQIPVLDGRGAVADVLLWVDFLGDRAPAPAPCVTPLEHTVVIMAGGRGTRLDPFTRILPKPLIPLGDKPIVENIMDRFFENGFSRFIMIVNYKREMIRAYFSEGTRPYQLSFVDEQEYCGTAGGLSLLRGALEQTFVVTNCDTILGGTYRDFLTWHRDSRSVVTIVGSHKEITLPYGVLCMKNGALEKIDEKPKLDLFINTGTYLFEPSVFDFIADREHLDMDTLIGRIKARGVGGVGVYPHWGGWFDIGQWEEYHKTTRHLGGGADDAGRPGRA